jgi:predicted nucleic acid-binding protein
MAAFVCDTSGLMKRYVSETGSAWVNTLLGPAAGNLIYLARITGVELVAALTRRQRGGSITPTAYASMIAQFHYDFANRFLFVNLTNALIARAIGFAETYGLRGYDAVQLAAAVRVQQRRLAAGSFCILVSADAELNAAAVAEGLAVEDPNNHP